MPLRNPYSSRAFLAIQPDPRLLTGMQQRLRSPVGSGVQASSLSYRPTPKRLMVIPLADALGATSQEKNENLVSFNSMLSCYEQLAKNINAQSDVVRALAYSIGTNYTLYNPNSRVSDKAAGVLVNQLHSALNTEAAHRASDSEKQKLYELSVILGSYSLSLASAAAVSGYASRLEEARLLAGEGLRFLLKADPNKLTLTDRGLMIAA